MKEFFIEFTTHVIKEQGAFGFLVAALLEEIIVFLPSSLVMMAGGFFLIRSETVGSAVIEILLILTPLGTLGVMTGSVILYLVSKYGEELVLKRFSKYVGISWQQVQKMQNYFQKKKSDEITLLILRAIPVFPGSITAILAGFIRMPFANFVIFGSIGSAIRIFVMGLIGWYAKETYGHLAARFESLSSWLTIALIVSIIFTYSFLKKKIDKIIWE